MSFEVGDTVRVIEEDSYKGKTGVIVGSGAFFEWLVRMEGMSDSPAEWWGYNSRELELVAAAAVPEVGDTVRVTLDGKVERSEERDGGVLMVGVSDGGAVWIKAKHAEVVSKAVKEPVVLGVGDKVVVGATAPVGALAAGTGLTPLMFDGKGWVYVTTPSVYATNPVVLSSYVVTFVPPVIDSK